MYYVCYAAAKTHSQVDGQSSLFVRVCVCVILRVLALLHPRTTSSTSQYLETQIELLKVAAAELSCLKAGRVCAVSIVIRYLLR